MTARKIAITMHEELVEAVDEMVKEQLYPNRSQAIQAAVREKVAHRHHTRLAREARKLSPREEQAWAEEGLTRDAEAWPEY